MALALNNLQKVDMSLNKQTNQPTNQPILYVCSSHADCTGSIDCLLRSILISSHFGKFCKQDLGVSSWYNG